MENVRELFELDEDDSIFQTKKEKGTEEAFKELQERQEIASKEELVEYGKDIAYLVQYIATHPGETMDFMQGKIREGWEFSQEHPFDAMKTVGTEVGLWFLPTVVLKSISGVVKVGQMARAFRAMYSVEKGVVVGKEARGAVKVVEGGAKIVVEDSVPLALPAPKMVKHHVFNKFRGISEKSQKYRDFFQKHQIDIDGYSISISESFHRSQIHGAGKNWTTKWKTWIDLNPGASSKDVYQFAGKLMDEYNVSHIPIERYIVK
jgi:hypothetical protein